MSDTIDSIRIIDMPDLGAIDDSSSVVGERLGSGRFMAPALRNYCQAGTYTGPVHIDLGTTTAFVNPTPALSTNWVFADSGGVNTTIDTQSNNMTKITGPAGQAIWANRDQVWYQSPTPSNTGASYIARVMTTENMADRGTAPGAPQVWAAIMNMVDETGHKSSVSGNLLTVEIDIGGALADDANVRSAVVINAGTYNYPTVATSEFASAIGIFTGDVGASFKKLINMGAPFSAAGIDFIGATSISGAPAIRLFDGMSIAFDQNNNATFSEDGSGNLGFHWLGTPTITVTPAGDINFNTNAVINMKGSNKLFRVIDPAGALLDAIDGSSGTIANYLRITAVSAGTAPGIGPVGTDTNIDLALGGKGAGQVRFTTGIVLPPTLINAANDAGAAAGGVPVGSMYRNGSALMVRLV